MTAGAQGISFKATAHGHQTDQGPLEQGRPWPVGARASGSCPAGLGVARRWGVGGCPQGGKVLPSPCTLWSGPREGQLAGHFQERPPGGRAAPPSVQAAGVDEPAWAPSPGLASAPGAQPTSLAHSPALCGLRKVA